MHEAVVEFAKKYARDHVEEYAQEYAQQQSVIAVIKTKMKAIKKLVAKNFTLTDALEINDLDRETYEKYLAAENDEEDVQI